MKKSYRFTMYNSSSNIIACSDFECKESEMITHAYLLWSKEKEVAIKMHEKIKNAIVTTDNGYTRVHTFHP